MMNVARAVTDGRHDFDFLHGDWAVRNRRIAEPLRGGESWQEFVSSATVRPILHGLGNIDTFSASDMPGVGAFEGLTVRLFDPAQGRWNIYWASTGRPGRQDPPLSGGFDDGKGIFYGEDRLDGRPIRVRFVWSVGGADRASWDQAFSPDDGRSWEVNWVMDLARLDTADADG